MVWQIAFKQAHDTRLLQLMVVGALSLVDGQVQGPLLSFPASAPASLLPTFLAADQTTALLKPNPTVFPRAFLIFSGFDTFSWCQNPAQCCSSN